MHPNRTGAGRGYHQRPTLTTPQAEALASASTGHAQELVDLAHGQLEVFIASVTPGGRPPQWITLADAITALDRATDELRAVQRLAEAA